MKSKQKRKPVNPAKIKKLSDLLALGLDDARKQERAKNSLLRMDSWLVTQTEDDVGVCRACLAGSVLRWTCGITGTAPRGAVPCWCMALDFLRQGAVGRAFEVLTNHESELAHLLNCEVRVYEYCPAGWWADMHRLLRNLQKAGL